MVGRSRRGRGWAVVLAFGGLAGCGGSDGPPKVAVHEVTGRVLLADGRPMSGGRVAFVPEDGAMTSEGAIGPDGSFALSTGPSGPGAPEGRFRVRVEPGDASLLPGRARVGKAKSRLPFPAKYLDEDLSGLRVTVGPGPNAVGPLLLK